MASNLLFVRLSTSLPQARATVQALTRLVDLAIMCPGCPLQGDASLCRPVCWPKLQLLHLKIDEGVWRVPSRGQECYCLEDTINSASAL